MADARRVAHRALSDLDNGRISRLSGRLGDAGSVAPLARELALGVERRRPLLDHVLLGYLDRGLPKDGGVRSALRLGAYQLLFATGIPPHAAVHETVSLLSASRGGGQMRRLANAVLRRVAADIDAAPEAGEPVLELEGGRRLLLRHPLPDIEVEPAAHLAIRHGVPGFLAERWVARLGRSQAEEVAAACARVPAVFLRARLSTDGAPNDLVQALAGSGVELEPTEHRLVWRWIGGASPFATDAFRAGAFVVQDPTAVEAALALGAQPGETVLDFCAAPGTKASLLADQVGAEGRVLAFDVDRDRRSQIRDNARRLGLGQLAIVDDPSAGGPVDRVLADVPCSNTGVLARRVEARRRLAPESLTKLVPIQERILRQALRRVRPDGSVVYSTCSIEPEENGDLVRRVAADASWAIVAERETLPATPRCDGGYFAVLRRGG